MNPVFYILLLSVGVMASQGKQPKAQFKSSIGVIVDLTPAAGKQELVAIKMAEEDFFLSTGHKPVLHVKDSQGNPVRAALDAVHLMKEEQVQAIVGLRTWKEAAFIAEVGAKIQVPVVSFSANAPPMLTPGRWPFLIRLAESSHLQMKAVASMVGSWQWRRVTIIYEDNNYGSAGIMTYLIRALREVDVDIDYQSIFPPFASLSNSRALIREELEKMMRNPSRVFIVHSSLPLSIQLFEEAKIIGMMEKDYVWITTETITNYFDYLNVSIISSMQGVVGVKTYFPQSTTKYRDFSIRLRRRFRSYYPEEDDSEPGIFAVRAYDAILLVLTAIERLRVRDNLKPHPLLGRPLLEGILSNNYEGLSGKIQFKGTELVPAPAFQIVNVVGRSYREIGFWSRKSGFFRSIDGEDIKGNKNRTSIENLGHVIWPGDPPYLPRGWVITSSGKPLRIAVPGNSSFEKVMSVKYNATSNETSIGGFSIDVFQMVVKNLPYDLPYKFIPYYGSYDSMVEQVSLGKYDAVVGDTAIVGKRCKYGEFSQPYSESGVRMVVHVKPQPGKAWIFIKPFTKEMWALTVALIMYNGLIVWYIEREGNEQSEGSFSNQVGILVWLSFNTLFSLHGGRLGSNLSRMAMVVWLFVALILTQSYTANLSSMLTVQKLEPSVVDVESLRESKAMIGCDQGSFVMKFLEEVLHFDRKCIKPFAKGEDYPAALRSGEIKAAFLEVPYIKYLLAKNCKGYMAAGPTYEIGGFGYVFSKGSPIVADISQAILKLREDGKIRDLEKDLILSTSCSSSEVEDENGSLSLDSFWGLFAITGATSTLALLLFILKRLHQSWWNRCLRQAFLVAVLVRQLILASLGKHSSMPTRRQDQQPNSAELTELGTTNFSQ